MKLVTIVGARPQFIKAAAVHRAVVSRGDIDDVLVHTGQHFDDDMSAVFFEELELPPPRHHLGIHGCGHGEMTGAMMTALEPIVAAEAPAAVVVHGDTNSTLAGALVAAKLRIPVVHIEAGLRSFDRAMPEEINRVVTDHVSTLRLCPTQAAIVNLRREGITDGVHHVGDVMYDAALFAAARARDVRPSLRERLGLAAGPYAVATVHREHATESPGELGARVSYLRDRARAIPIVWPLHPRTRDRLARWDIATDGLRVCSPLGPIDMAGLVAGASAVYTDSGGLQKEAYFFRVPCVTMRSETEWVETIAAGWNRLWTDPDPVRERRDIPDYGDGDAAARAAAVIARELGTR